MVCITFNYIFMVNIKTWKKLISKFLLTAIQIGIFWCNLGAKIWSQWIKIFAERKPKKVDWNVCCNQAGWICSWVDEYRIISNLYVFWHVMAIQVRQGKIIFHDKLIFLLFKYRLLFKSKTGKLRYEVHKRIFANSAPSAVVAQPGKACQACVNSQLFGIFSKQMWLKVLLS